MRKLLFSLLIICSSVVIAKEPENTLTESASVTSVVTVEQTLPDLSLLQDQVDKENKVRVCMDEYIFKQSKSYAKIVKNNLYDLMNDFSRITSRIYGKKPEDDIISYEDKLEVLAKIQCEAYYALGIIK